MATLFYGPTEVLSTGRKFWFSSTRTLWNSAINITYPISQPYNFFCMFRGQSRDVIMKMFYTSENRDVSAYIYIEDRPHE